jgi:Type I phosphodiesterase / nucleotide pyrophosphatase
VCLTSIATGAFPDVHHIPHLVWYHRGEERVVEYGSSFPAMRAVGARRAIKDTIFGMSAEHLAASATTVFEALEDADLEPAAINFTCYRGRTRHPLRLPAVPRRNRWYEAVYGPRHFFYYNLFESERTGAPLAVRSRLEGSIDEYAAAVGRWLVTRDAFDFLVFYLPDYDYASHLAGPGAAAQALERSDEALGRLLEAAGGAEAFLERYAVLVCSDHGQTRVERLARLQSSYPESEDGVLALASNRAGMVYRLPGCKVGVRSLAERLDDEPGADVVLFLEDGAAVARREGAELRFAPDGDAWRVEGDAAVLDPDRYPNGVERAWHALRAPTAGDVLVSATEGWELADGGGRHHLGGGSHGSLVAGDSLVPVLAAGLGGAVLPPEPSITDLAPVVLEHFGVPPPASMRKAREAARA